MSANVFEIKQYNLLPLLQVTLQDDDGTAIDLTGTTQKIYISDKKGNFILNGGVMTEVDYEAGQIRYTWVDGDTDLEGVYHAEVVVTYTASSKTLSFPTSGYLCIRILQSLAPEA